MFDWMIPMFTDEGFEQFLLEVITTNDPAIRLYEQLGFHRTRELLLLESEPTIDLGREPTVDVEIREIHRHENIPVRIVLGREAVLAEQRRSSRTQRSDEASVRCVRRWRCVGYIVFSSGMGRLAQIAVHRDHRRKGIGTRLLLEMQKDSTEQNLQVINLDESMTESVVFFQNRGFKKVLGQYEMLMEL
jgi:ribosomal protein S18 acetylase RimI-like enzyme